MKLGGPKDSIFSGKHFINCKGKLLPTDKPMIMGILNCTPDSFYDGGKNSSLDEVLKHTEKMLKDGAQIIDVGGYSSRPGAKEITAVEEKNRVLPVIKLLIDHFPDILISIDTFRSSIAKQAVEHGAAMINDISAGELDSAMFNTVASLNVPYIMMHMQGTPQNMQINPTYENITGTLINFFSKKLTQLKALGVNDVILDPGFGFGKSLEDNYQLLADLEAFKVFNLPILVGVSRKSMINRVLSTSPENALNGSTVVHTIALTKGVNIVRVHDVKEAKEALKIVNYLQKN